MPAWRESIERYETNFSVEDIQNADLFIISSQFGSKEVLNPYFNVCSVDVDTIDMNLLTEM